MRLSRKEMKNTEDQVKQKDPSAFIEAAEVIQPAPTPAAKPVGRPKANRELTKPVSVSLTDSDKKTLDNQAKRYNVLCYQRDKDALTNLTRSDVVKLMAQHLDSMEDDDFYNYLNKIIN